MPPETATPSPREAYALAAQQPGFVDDPAQRKAIDALEHRFAALHSGGRLTQPGLYLWGPVGRGKTWLMDLFHRCLRIRSRRQHFHHFMRWVHRRLFALTGVADPLKHLAGELASDIQVLCFDEFFVSDIGDAMLLGPLFQAMIDAGIVIVATSNQAPDQLYADGFNRERFVPAIAALQDHMQVVELDGALDHRQHPRAGEQRYWVDNRRALAEVFSRLRGPAPASHKPRALNGRSVAVVQSCASAIWLRFADICEQPFGAQDFMALCDHYPAILLEGVPGLSGQCTAQRIARGTEDAAHQVAAGDRQLPALSVKDDSVRRFIALVDECYDRGVPLYVEAAVPLLELYTAGHLIAPFRRTLSRLQAMQYRQF
ncbi:cell division protein ZapE [Parahaliea mediterranea]|uniref:AFG1 family ATPase n=1 Tax=Parahaliea mediterranea TaxID=651086 RepID=A0A939DEH0_9GAMM|nr:cell division protein ZapE [Parahaliea mediterranea]MBN7796406.1 AFG1 family ATPase [Parahaliea mediterranea]